MQAATSREPSRQGSILNRVLLTALVAGAAAGLLLGAIQQFAVVPMILKAETYEVGAPADGSQTELQARDHEHSDEHGAWSPAPGGERGAYTIFTTVLSGIGFGMLLSACYALRGYVSWRMGLLWGLGGFATFHLAPAIGLPPELPGAAAAELGARQTWWLLTVSLTAVGLALAVFEPRVPVRALGLLLIVAPHIIGAPAPEVHEGLAPVELERAFIGASLASNAVFWLVLGVLTAVLSERFGAPRHAETGRPPAPA